MRAAPPGAYGMDAPWVPVGWIVCGAVAAAGAIVVSALWQAPWATVIAVYLAACAALYTAGAGTYVHATLRGKFVVWRTLLDEVPADEASSVLDLGCGRGAVAIMAARRFPVARITGVDLWRSVDQSGNTLGAAVRNARANDLAERVAFVTADMRELPFDDTSFDLVTASLSIHNLPTAEERAAALHEAVRVLRPGGRLVMLDIRRVREYAAALSSLGVTVEPPRRFGWRVWWTGPWMAATALSVRKPV